MTDTSRALALSLVDSALERAETLLHKCAHGFDRDEDGFSFIVEHHPDARCHYEQPSAVSPGRYVCHCGLRDIAQECVETRDELRHAREQLKRLGAGK